MTPEGRGKELGSDTEAERDKKWEEEKRATFSMILI